MAKVTIGALQGIVRTQAQEIRGLREELSRWESSDIGQLQQRAADLEAKSTELSSQCDDLRLMTASLASLCMVAGTGLIGLLSDRVTEIISQLPNLIDESKKQELRERLDEQQVQFVEAVIQLDTIALKAFEREQKRIRERVDTLPPHQRVVFEALKQLTRRNQLGSALLGYLQHEEMFADLMKHPYIKDRLNLIGTLLDLCSNSWPLVATNAFTPLLRFMGVDEAAQAAGDILDALEQQEKVPRRYIPKVKPDLVRMGAIQERTKPDTIAEYLTTGFQLEKFGLSPEQASYREVDASVSHLKRAQKSYRALVQLYNRTSEETPNEFMEMLETATKGIAEAFDNALCAFQNSESDEMEARNRE